MLLPSRPGRPPPVGASPLPPWPDSRTPDPRSNTSKHDELANARLTTATANLLEGCKRDAVAVNAQRGSVVLQLLHTATRQREARNQVTRRNTGNQLRKRGSVGRSTGVTEAAHREQAGEVLGSAQRHHVRELRAGCEPTQGRSKSALGVKRQCQQRKKHCTECIPALRTRDPGTADLTRADTWQSRNETFTQQQSTRPCAELEDLPCPPCSPGSGPCPDGNRYRSAPKQSTNR